MKKFIYLFIYLFASIIFILVAMIACEEASLDVEELQTTQEKLILEKVKKTDKVTICHYDTDLDESYQITISMNGLNGHMGDETTPRHEGDNFDPLADDADGDGIGDCADCDNSILGGEESMKKMWYMDADGDGYGTDDFIKTCNPRPEMNYTATMSGDCNDDDAAINPDATEVCDGVDNNCDGEIDEGVKTTFYQDLDGDTFGNPDVSVEACEAPEGYVADNTDCDDTKLPYSPEGDYTIYRDNGAVLNITILDDGTITGSGYTSNGPSDPQTYTGTTTVNIDHTTLLLVLQDPQGGTHHIEGIVSECDGITELTNDYRL